MKPDSMPSQDTDRALRGLSSQDPACTAGKLIGLLDLRAKLWRRLEWREAVQENCRVDMLDAPRKDSQSAACCFSTWATSASTSLIP